MDQDYIDEFRTRDPDTYTLRKPEQLGGRNRKTIDIIGGP